MSANEIVIDGKLYGTAEWDTANLADIGEPNPDNPTETPMTGRLPEPEAGSLAAAKLALRRASEPVDWFDNEGQE